MRQWLCGRRTSAICGASGRLPYVDKELQEWRALESFTVTRLLVPRFDLETNPIILAALTFRNLDPLGKLFISGVMYSAMWAKHFGRLIFRV
jgi:uncharacterized OB-fold protein